MIALKTTSGLGLALCLALCSAALAAAPGPGGDPVRGRQVFDAVGCYECHGHVGQGGSSGPRIAPNPPSLTALAGFIRKPMKEMPPYGAKVLSAQDIVDIHAYLASLPPPPPPARLKILALPETTHQ